MANDTVKMIELEAENGSSLTGADMGKKVLKQSDKFSIGRREVLSEVLERIRY